MAETAAPSRLDDRLRGHLAMLGFSAVIAGSFSLGGLVANRIAPAALNAPRFLIAAIAILIVARSTTGMPARVFRAPWRYLVLGGLFAFYFITMFEGLKTAPPVSSAAVFTLTPVLSGAFGWLLLRQVTTPRMAAALAIGATGALWVIFRADLSALLAFHVGRGEAIFFWGVVAHALYTPLMRRLNRGETPAQMSFGVMAAGFLVLAAYGWRDILATDWAALPPVVWITLLYISLLAGSGSTMMLQYAAMRLPSAKVMAYTYLTPTWVILWEIALGRGAPRPLILAGIALTVAALVILLKDEEAPRRA